MIRLVFASLALALMAQGASAQDKMKETPYYPLQIGNSWTYKAGESEFVLKVVKHEKIGKDKDAELCARVEMTSAGDPKTVIAVDHVCVKDDGVYRYSFGDKMPDKPIRFLKLPLKKGDTWEVDTKALGEPIKGTFKIDEADVKIGTTSYKTFTSRSEDLVTADIKIDCTFYFAENVGLVKQVIKTGGQEILVELKKFEAAGGGVKK